MLQLSLARRRSPRQAARYLADHGLSPVLASGDPSAIPPNVLDLRFLHQTVRRMRPRAIVELGCGNSTIALAHALAENYREDAARLGPSARRGCVYAVDGNPQWIANTEGKLPPELHGFVELRYSEAEAQLWGSELCHVFRKLPNVCPELIFVDGPHAADVSSDVHGLTFTPETQFGRPAIAADPLLYESTLRKGALILVDGRKANTLFLRRMLKRKYRFQWHRSPGLHGFELVE